MMDYGYQHPYNTYPEYYHHPPYAQQYPPYSMVNFLTSSSGTGTTPILTPTTLVSLEQTFTELQSRAFSREGGDGVGGGPSGAAVGTEPQTQSGFVPPIVDASSSREHSQDSFESQSDPEWEPDLKRGRESFGSYVTMEGSSGSTGSTSSAAPQRKYTRRSRHEKLSPEEERRRSVRRERNKVAAAKCRQRRVDHTNMLVEETEQLESVKSDLESEIQTLQQQRDQLEFILQTHVPICKVDSQSGRNFKIKIEPSDFAMVAATTAACSAHHHHSPSLPSSSSSSSSPSTRPKSLALDKRSEDLPVVVSCAGPGIALSTPSSGLFTYTSLDSLVDGSTGLTPLTAGPVSCSSQMHKSENESGTDAVTSPTLISL